MSILFACPCGKKLHAKVQAAGKTTKCPACGGRLSIPIPADMNGPSEESHVRFLAIVLVLAVVGVASSVSVINRIMANRQLIEARATFQEVVSKSIEAANAFVLMEHNAKAAISLREAISSRPNIDLDDQNKVSLGEAEALLTAVEVVSTDTTTKIYLQGLDATKLKDILNGKNDLSPPIVNSKTRRAVDAKLALLAPSILEEKQNERLVRLEERKKDLEVRLEAAITKLTRDLEESGHKILTVRTEVHFDLKTGSATIRTRKLGNTLRGELLYVFREDRWDIVSNRMAVEPDKPD
jgi:hypothetical protein